MIADFAPAERYQRAFRSGLQPDPLQTVDEWADEHVQLPSHAAEAGRWRTSRTPFLREILQCLSPSHPCNEVVLMKSHQIGGTTVAVNWMGYVIDRAPGAMMIVEPTVDLAKKLSKQKVQPMLDLTACLKDKVKEARSRDSGNTLLAKEFLGGMLVFTGSNSGVGLRFMSARYLVLDELDAYVQDVDGEGSPEELAENRTSTHARRKIFKLSTPLDAEISRIEPAYNAGSRGRYHVPCPFCLTTQVLTFAGLVFTFNGIPLPHEAAYKCASCEQLIPEHHKGFMFENGKWVHEDPDNPIRSFHLNSLLMPYGWPLSWGEIARRHIRANKKAKTGDRRALKAFVNTILAETWQEIGERADKKDLWERRETYAYPCPDGVLVLTASVDTQDDRLEAEIQGWGKNFESWSIGFRRFYGNPTLPQVWVDLEMWLLETRQHESGIALRVECVTVDVGGHHADEGFRFVKSYRGGRIFAIRGSNQLGAPLIPPKPGKSHHAQHAIWFIGTTAAKDTILQCLKLTEPGPGYMHHPDYPEYDEEYFEQLASEEKRLKYHKGIMQGHYYKKIRPRNEALDLKVYGRAALSLGGFNLEVLSRQWRDRLAPAAPAPPRKQSNWMNPQEETKPRSGWMKRDR